MTIEQMHIGVNIELQSVASYSFDDFLPEEIDYYINRAIRQWVRGKQASLINSGMEASSLISEDLYTIMKTIYFKFTPTINDGTLTTSTQYPNAVAGNLSTIKDEDFYLYLYSRTKIDTLWKNNKFVAPTKFIHYATTSTDTPYFRDLPLMLQGNSLFVLRSVEDDSIDEVFLTYIKKPAEVAIDVNDPVASVSCDLPDHTHDDIVTLAVTLMLRDLSIQQQ